MDEAKENVDDALEQLKSAEKNQKKAGKCTKCLIWIIVLLLIGVALIIYFNFFYHSG